MITQSIARDAEPVVLDQDFSRECNGLWITAPGSVSVVLPSRKTIVFGGVQPGFFGIHALRVNSAGTTATVQNAVFI